jgi:HEAT repeat protein
VLNDRRFRRSWPMAICLLGYIGNEKTLEKLRDFAERNFKNWIKGEFFDIDKALIYALSSFSNRGFDSATEVLFVGTKPGFWRMLIKTKYPKTKKLEEKVELLTSHCILALVYLTTPKALELLEELRNDLEYPLQSDVAFAISEIKERNSRNP